jgi:hypothetical protein
MAAYWAYSYGKGNVNTTPPSNHRPIPDYSLQIALDTEIYG